MSHLRELLNHRVSYQIIVTFDLAGADTSAYATLREELSNALDLESVIHTSVTMEGKRKSFHTTRLLLYGIKMILSRGPVITLKRRSWKS